MLQLSFVNYKKGAYLFVEGKSDNDRFLIIQSGKVILNKVLSVETAPVTLGPGDFVGVVSCMSNHAQIESAIALTDVVAIAVRRDQYTELIQKNTPVAMKIIRTFANKMRVMNDSLTKLTLKNTTTDSPEQFFAVAQYYEKNAKLDMAIFAYYQYLKACPNGQNIQKAKERFIALKPRSHAVYFEPTKDQIRTYPKETMIFCENQTGADMFIIQEGQVKISKVIDGNEMMFAVLKKGEFFGEMALLENKPRSASASAFEDCKLMVVNRQNFEQMVSTQPQMIARLTTTLAERIWSMTRQLENTRIKNPVHQLFDMLSLQLEKMRFNFAPGSSHTFDLTPYDLAKMCGFPKEMQATYLNGFLADSRVKLVQNKIFIADCSELYNSSVFYRKQAVLGK